MIWACIVAGLAANMLIGAIAWCLVDTDGRFFAWYEDGAKKMPLLVPILVLNLWPAVFWVLWVNRRTPR